MRISARDFHIAFSVLLPPINCTNSCLSKNKMINNRVVSPTFFCDYFIFGYCHNIAHEATDDVATVKWGKRCHIPTATEMNELYHNCYWTPTNNNTLAGYTVTGPNGNSIFLPLAGRKSSGIELKGQTGYYWSSSISNDYIPQSMMIDFGISVLIGGYFNCREVGFSIRPVARK